MINSQAISSLVDLVVKYKEEIESLNLGLKELTHIPQLQPYLKKTDEKFLEAFNLQGKIIERINKLNPGMLTDQIIVSQILYNTITELIHTKAKKSEAIDEIRKIVSNLTNYDSLRRIDIPIILLKVLEPYKFGPITFYPFTEEDIKSEWGAKIINSVDSIFISSMCYASVDAPGDHYFAMSYAYNKVSDGLNILKGLGLPITDKYTTQVAIMDNKPSVGNLYFRLSKPEENIKIDPYSGITTQVDGPITAYNLKKDILSNIEVQKLGKIEDIVSTDNYFSPTNRIHAKLIRGFEWLGEATRNDTLEGRFAKIAFSVEALIGGESRRDLFTRSIGATLAERSAFLVGETLDERLDIDKQIRSLYGKRSDIVHGKKSNIIPSELNQFGEIVRRVGWGLIDNMENFTKVEELDSWVRKQSYSEKK